MGCLSRFCMSLALFVLLDLRYHQAFATATSNAWNVTAGNTYCSVRRAWMSRRFVAADCAGALQKLHLGDAVTHGYTEIQFLRAGGERNSSLCNQVIPRRYVHGLCSQLQYMEIISANGCWKVPVRLRLSWPPPSPPAPCPARILGDTFTHKPSHPTTISG